LRLHKLKKLASHERRVHSFDSLLVACGWGEEEASVWVDSGVVLVDGHGEDVRASEDEMVQILKARRLVLGDGKVRKEIVVLGCGSG
jgi:DNA ligase-4